jgi:hypothetical protein
MPVRLGLIGELQYHFLKIEQKRQAERLPYNSYRNSILLL